MSGTDTFDLTLERIALIRRMVVAWNGTGPGAPMIHPNAPYGSADRDGDIFNVTGDDEGADEEHRAMGDALAVFLHNAVLKPGRYQYHNPLAKLDPAESRDVFRDEATGETPEHITFEVTDAHLKLMPHLNLAWDEARAVPVIDSQRPYGASEPYTAGMAAYLGAAAGAAGDLERLHREMQPALQIFLRYGDLGPELFRRSAGGWQAA